MRLISCLILSLMILVSCDNEEIVGCSDPIATNYNVNDTIYEKFGCCYDCDAYYDGVKVDSWSNLCGDLDSLLSLEYGVTTQVWIDPDGNFVFPGTANSLPYFNSDGSPVIQFFEYELICGD